MDLSTETSTDWIVKVLNGNLTFAKANSAGRACFTEIIELLNDLIDALQQVPKNAEEITKSAKWVFLSTSLLPLSYGIYVDFLAGNLPVCFMQLRTLTEALAQYFDADKKYKFESFFYDKLVMSAEVQRAEGRSLSRVIESVDKDAADLWRRCSQWVHARTLAEKLVTQVADYGVPTWGLVIPMEYSGIDEKLLYDLQSDLAQFRIILAHVLKRWI